MARRFAAPHPCTWTEEEVEAMLQMAEEVAPAGAAVAAAGLVAAAVCVDGILVVALAGDAFVSKFDLDLDLDLDLERTGTGNLVVVGLAAFVVVAWCCRLEEVGSMLDQGDGMVIVGANQDQAHRMHLEGDRYPWRRCRYRHGLENRMEEEAREPLHGIQQRELP